MALAVKKIKSNVEIKSIPSIKKSFGIYIQMQIFYRD